MKQLLFISSLLCFSFLPKQDQTQGWIRINLLGYRPHAPKVAVWCSKQQSAITDFQLVNITTGKVVYSGKAGKAYGAYGPFSQTYRLNFSVFTIPGRYMIRAAGISSPEFNIGEGVYKGAADFCLRYMRQQRSGFNPFLKDSCHTHDGYTLYGPMPDSTHIDVSGGWHDATDYLQYVTTSANATYHLLMAYRDFPAAFSDLKKVNGLDGSNGIADIMDEARWGLDWLLKMHPKDDWMFNQLADDRDHAGMRLPKEDSFYGRGFERPVYFVSGSPQQRQKFMNKTTGTSSTAAKFASAFGLGYELFSKNDNEYSTKLKSKAMSAYAFALKKPGVSQTASVKAPYIYEEDNWVDDMELASAVMHRISDGDAQGNYLREAMSYARQEPHTPWLGKDTARHYQWYPFINLGHYELAKQQTGKQHDSIVAFYKEGILKVWDKAKQNAFYRGIPFIWCSNNLTTSFAIQCYWYRQLTKDMQFSEFEQANFDWLFGCNPWGTSMVYGLPFWGDTPVDPHSSLTVIGKYPIDGGLVDGPVYGNIYNNLIGIKLAEPDEYEMFQSNLAVYHDDYGDFSTNEPTMDGTASLIYLLAAQDAAKINISATAARQPEKKNNQQQVNNNFTYSYGAITRGDSTSKQIALVFTGDEFGDGGEHIMKALQEHRIRASFFLTGRFYRNASFKKIVSQLKSQGHYLGAHSNEHLLYCDWNKRDSLLVTAGQFKKDLLENYRAMETYGIRKQEAAYFLPPYEWYNDSIALWTKQLGLSLINYTPGTISHTDYTTPEMKNYRDSKTIYESIVKYEAAAASGLNGFILLVHIGTDPARTDKFYLHLGKLLKELQQKGYEFVRVDQLLVHK